MPIGLRGDFDAACLRAVARRSKDGAQTRSRIGTRIVDCGPAVTSQAHAIPSRWVQPGNPEIS
jgi:hypothetical protein